MSSQSFLLAGALTFVALLCLELYKQGRRHKRNRDAPVSAGRNVDVRVVELGSTLRAHIFRRPGGSFGYYYARKAEADDDCSGAAHWSDIAGPGSVFDSAERAEEYARRGASDAT